MIGKFFEVERNTYINPMHVVEIVPYVENSEFDKVGDGFLVRMTNGSEYRINEVQFRQIDKMLKDDVDELVGIITNIKAWCKE